MAWEKFTDPRPNSRLPLLGLSLAWIALVIAGAWLTNFDEPYLPFAIAGGLVFFLRGKPSRWEIYAWLLGATAFVKIIHLSRIPFWVLRVASGFACLGFAAILLLGLRALWSEREERERAWALLTPALILIFFILVSANVLRFSGSLHPQTCDAWLYAFDGSLGFQPSFFLGRVMFGSLALTRSALLTYLALPFAMAVVCAWKTPPQSRRVSWHMLIVLMLAGVGGWILYNVVPGTGPIYAFGKDFPWRSLPYRALPEFPLARMAIPPYIPRNAMPSLHMGWALLLFWNSRGFPRVLRVALFLFLLLTVVATMGGGQHYFVDLVVSLPFALAVQAAASLMGPGRRQRIAILATGLAITFSWLLLVRFGLPLMLGSPVIPWLLILTTVGVTFYLENRISRNRTSDALPEKARARRGELVGGLR